MSVPKKPVKRASEQYAKQQASPSTEENGGKGELVDYLPLVKYIAGRLAIGLPRSVEMDDLINAGVIGLIEAYSNFDVDKGVKFETYASLRIRGSILDELRGLDWVPRSTRARSREVERTISKLEAQLGRSATEAELADERQANGADRAVPLLTDDDLGNAFVLGIFVVHLVPVHEHDDVGVLLDGAGFPQVRVHRALVGPLLKAPVKLGQGHHRATCN